MSRRWGLLLVVLAALSAGLVACGGGDDGDDDPRALLEETFTGDSRLTSGRLDLRLALDLRGFQGLDQPIDLRLRGPFRSTADGKLPRFSFTLRARTGGQTIDTGATSTGERGYVAFAGQSFTLPEATFDQFRRGYEEAQRRNGGQREREAQALPLGVKPQDWLVDPKEVGTQDVGGTKTTHLQAGVDVPKLLADLDRILGAAGRAGAGGRLSEAQRRQVEEAVESAKVDVFTGEEDRRLRRMAVDVQLRDTATVNGGSARFAFEIADLNEEVDVPTPSGARPLEELLRATGGALPGVAGAVAGGAAGGTATSPAPAPGGAATTPSAGATTPSAGATTPSAGGAQGRYLQCLQEAG